MTTATSRRPRERRADTAIPDRGCQYAPRCADCPWATCVKELPKAEHLAFVAALKLVKGYLAEPDGVADT